MKNQLRDRVSFFTQKLASESIADDDVLQAAEDPLVPLLSPWSLWLLQCCLRQERRQIWVGYIVESRLKAEGDQLAKAGAFGHPEDLPQSGEVPGEPEWRYFFHGRGCCLTHRDGTRLDVDFADDGTALEIDPYFFTEFLTSAPASGWYESRLRRSQALENAWQADLIQLLELELISGAWRFRLTEQGRTLAEDLEPLTDLIANTNGIARCWVLTVLGDYISALETAGNCRPDTILLLETKASEQRRKRARLLESIIASSANRFSKHALEALALLGPSFARPHLEKALLGEPVSANNHTALEIFCAQQNDEVDSLLLRALKKFDRKPGFLERFTLRTAKPALDQERPRLGLIVKIAGQMFVRHSPATMPKGALSVMEPALRKDCVAMDDDAGFLLYLVDPKAGLAKLSSALSSRVPIVRIGAAAFLALISSKASIALLVRTAEGPPEAGGHEAACALSLIRDEQAKAAAHQWERRHDGYEDIEGNPVVLGGREFMTWSFADIMRSSTRSSVEHALKAKIEKYSPVLKRWRGQI